MNSSFELRTRREFLRTSALGGALSWTIPSFLSSTFSALHAEAENHPSKAGAGRDGTILVVLQMAGGNDGLNTVVPFANDHYYRARSSLALSGDSVLKLNDTLGFHGGLDGLKELYDSGYLSVIQGVGYPNPNRSHFRSTEIWQTASDADKAERHGWIGRYFDHACQGAAPTVGVNIGRQMPQAFASGSPLGVSLENPESYRYASLDQAGEDEMASSEPFYRQLNRPGSAAEMNVPAGGTIGDLGGKISLEGSPLDYLDRVALDAQVSSERILSLSNRVRNQADYPLSMLGNSLKLVARLIGGGLPTRVYYVSQGGYDTHTNQMGTHDRLLKELGDSLRAFVADLKAQGNFERVLVMTFSEFGRRVSQNANNGTDHGAAAPMFMIGQTIRRGLIGEQPSLAPSDLHNGDLKFAIDFRSVYAGVLEQWLRTASAPVLRRQFEPLPIVPG